MATSKITYNGGLRTTSVHERSGNEIITDAPVDNKGKGEAFSPTDLLATSLGNCMITIVGIAANEHGFNIDHQNYGRESKKGSGNYCQLPVPCQRLLR
jgi:putative redox protein